MSPNELSELAPIAATLNEESNTINHTIESLNDGIAALNLGIEVWCGPWDEDPYQIGYAKVQEGTAEFWQLAVRKCTPIQATDIYGNQGWEAEPGSYKPAIPLLRAARKIRIDGLTVLPQILKALKSEAEGAIHTIQQAKKLAAEICSPAAKPESDSTLPKLATIPPEVEDSIKRLWPGGKQ